MRQSNIWNWNFLWQWNWWIRRWIRLQKWETVYLHNHVVFPILLHRTTVMHSFVHPLCSGLFLEIFRCRSLPWQTRPSFFHRYRCVLPWFVLDSRFCSCLFLWILNLGKLFVVYNSMFPLRSIFHFFHWSPCSSPFIHLALIFYVIFISSRCDNSSGESYEIEKDKSPLDDTESQFGPVLLHVQDSNSTRH